MSGLNKNNLLEILRLKLEENLSQRQIARIMDCGRTTVQDFLLRKTHRNFWKDYDEHKVIKSVKAKKSDISPNHTFVVCAAQSNTPVHENFFKALKNYCEINDARLLISTFDYNRQAKEELLFDNKIKDFICDNMIPLSKDITFCGELDVSPTVVSPCSLFKRYHGEESIIIPHAKQDLLCLPSDKGMSKKDVFSSGCITLPNYKNNNFGLREEQNHVIGALVVEVDEDLIAHVRQLQCMDDSGEFYDLDALYSIDNVVYGQSASAITWGDIHAAKLDRAVANVSWDNCDSLLSLLKPTYQFVHDIFDMSARNSHNRKSQIYRIIQERNDSSSVEDEVRESAELLKSFERDYSTVVVVNYNHDQQLDRWLESEDYRTDDVNALYFLTLQQARYHFYQKEYDPNNPSVFNTLEYAYKSIIDFDDKHFKFLKQDEQFIVNKINCGQHGDKGNNGARGSVNAYINRCAAYNIGHIHSPVIRGKLFAAGVSGKLFMGYNTGADAWRQAHIVTYPNGARAVIFIKNNRYKA